MKKLPMSIGVIALLVCQGASAATLQNYDIRVLTSLYEAQLRRPVEDSYIAKRMSEERQRINAQAEKEAEELITENTKTEGADNASSALDRQRTLVRILEEQLNDRTVDIDLLEEEEKRYYTSPQDETGSVIELKITKNHADLLAKKAVLEERISALQASLTLQNERLSKLVTEKRLDQIQSLLGAGLYVVVLLLAIVLDRTVRRLILEKIMEKKRRYFVGKIITALIYIIASIWIINKLVTDHPNALASLAIIGAGIAIAMQDVIKDLLAWIIILQRRLFVPGNRIAIGTLTGDVIDIDPLRTTILETSSQLGGVERTGKMVSIPNAFILRESVTNFNATSDYLATEMTLTITHDSNWKKAEELCKNSIEEETRVFIERGRSQLLRRSALLFSSSDIPDPFVFIDVSREGIVLTLRFIAPIGRVRMVKNNITRSAIHAFSLTSDIRLAADKGSVSVAGS